MTGHLPLGTGGEFDAIRRLERLWGDAARGLGDDAAVLRVTPGRALVASIDTSLEDVHFRRAWLAPEEIGWRAASAALSDLAAMGAVPLGMLWALTLPRHDRDALDALARGVGAAGRAAGCPVVGGDLTAGDRWSLTMTVLGEATAPLTRGGARPGDVVWVTGALGGPGRALAAWLAGDTPAPADRARFAHPEARIAQGIAAAAAGASAAVDISDGLVSDAGHVAAASRVRVVLDLDRLPLVPGAEALASAASGEEYELLLVAPPGVDLSRALPPDVPVTAIGVVEAGAGVEARRRGARVEPAGGYDHFSGL